MAYRYIIRVLDENGVVGWLNEDFKLTNIYRLRVRYTRKRDAEAGAVLAAARHPGLIGNLEVVYLPMRPDEFEKVPF